VQFTTVMAIRLVGLDEHTAFIFRNKVVSVRMGISDMLSVIL